jgi:two-component system nitrogen regulation response regulator GlnG
MATILIIDDEPVIQHAFRKAFRAPEHEVLSAGAAAEGLELLRRKIPDVVILDVHLPDSDGLKTFEKVKAFDARIPVILITGHGTTELAIAAMKQGAFDYLLKPLEYDQIRNLVEQACASSRLMHVPAVMPEWEADQGAGDALLGRCAAMQTVYKAIGRVAPTDATVLILGESGTGKELVARAVYQHSKRAKTPFLAINCGAIPENLLESELFGHEKGAFTGADRKRIGKFEQCSGGTLFLDEVGELPLLAQVKLLRVLQEQSFERVGGTETIRTDVRLIAATNAGLEQWVAAGKFRSDLYFRLNVFTIALPPLRERGDDLDLLIDYFLARSARELERPLPVVPPESRLALRQYSWPGNIRELQSILKQALLQMNGSVLLPNFLPATILTPAMAVTPTVAGDGVGLNWDRFIGERLAAGSHDLYAESLALMERQLLTRVLERTGGNQLRAAELLGITRGSLRHKLKALSISIRAVCSEDEQGE